MKFKSNIEVQAGLEDNNASIGAANQVLTANGGTGAVQWSDISAISAAVNDIESNITYYEVKNSSGATIEAFKGVMAVGTDGNSGHILIDEMVADGSVEARYFLGVTRESIPNGGIGRVIAFGEVSQINTLAFTNGDVLWCDPAVPGNFTVTEPLGPNLKIPAAIVLNSATNGKIQVRVQGNEGIKDLYDTKIASQVDGNVLVWDNTTGVWFNDSTLNVDYTNSRVGIGTTTPGVKLHLKGVANGTDGKLYITEDASNGSFFKYDGSTNRGALGGLSTGGEGTVVDWSRAGSDVRFLTGNSERMRIDSAGNVGVGTTSPTHKLQVVGGGAFNSYLNVQDPDVSGNGTLSLSHDSTGSSLYSNPASLNGSTVVLRLGINNLEKMRIANNGNVGIGTTSPGGKLHVVGNGIFDDGVNGRITLDSISGTNRISSTTTGFAAYEDLQFRADNYIFSNGNTERMRITSAGNVGIGTTSPGRPLHVIGQTAIANAVDANSTGALLISCDGTSNKIYSRTVQNATGAHPIDFIQTSSTVMRIASNGNVGIGTTAPDGAFQVKSSGLVIDQLNDFVASSPVSRIFTTDGAVGGLRPSEGSHLVLQTRSTANRDIIFATGTTPTERVTIKGSGNVGIGATSPGEKLVVAGAIVWNGALTASQTSAGALDRSGNDLRIRAYGATAGTGNLVFRTGGGGGSVDSEAMRIDSSGNVGIGTTSPSNKLNVNGDIGYTGVIGQGSIYGNTGNSSFSTMQLYNPSTGYTTLNNQSYGYYFNTSGGTKVTILNNGNVGIGTTNPYSPLQVGDYTGTAGYSYGTAATFVSSFSTTRPTLMVMSTDNTTTQNKGGSIAFGGGSENTSSPYTYAQIKGAKEVAGAGYSGYMAFYTTPSNSDANTERMRITSGGNVGIGTTSPSEKLQVNGNIKLSSDAPIINATSTNNSSGLRYNTTGTASDTHRFQYNGTTQLVINSSGNVGIGTTSPSQKLEVSGGAAQFNGGNIDGNLGEAIFFGNTTYPNAQKNRIRSSISAVDSGNLLSIEAGTAIAGTYNNNQLVLKGDGNVGIGTDSPAGKLHIAPDAGSNYVFTGTSTSAYTATFNIDNTGLDIGHNSSSRSLNLKTDSLDRLTILGNGNVGIGTTSPTAPLDVFGVRAGRDWAIDNRAVIRLDSDGAAYPSDILFGHTAEANQTGWTGAYWSLSSRGSTADNKFFFFRASGNPTVSTEAVIMTFDPNLNVGIGTSSPGYKLDVNGSLHSTNLTIADAIYHEGDTNTYIQFVANDTIRWVTSGAERMRLNSSGNLGIGTSSPGATFHVNGTGLFSDNLTIPAEGKYMQTSGAFQWGQSTTIGVRMGNDSTAGLIDFRRWLGSGTLHHVAAVRQVLGGSSRFGLGFLADDISTNSGATTVRMYIDPNSGYVGVGTTSPDYPLHVVNNIASNDVTLFVGNQRAYALGDFSGGAVHLGKEEGGVNQTMGAIIGRPESQDNSTLGTLIFQTRTSGSPTEKMRITSTGRVGIGTTNPLYQLQLSTNSAAKPTSNVWTVVSDFRVKENIRPYTSGLDKVLQIEPKLFDYNGKAGFEKTKDNVGIIAQDMSKILPETINTYKGKLNEDDNEEIELYNYDGHALTFALVNAVKELNKQIEQLETRIQILENK